MYTDFFIEKYNFIFFFYNSIFFSAAVAIVASLNAHADGKSTEGESSLECGALEMLTDLCSATDSGE